MADHYYSFTREKNIIIFHDETADKTYHFDINSGKLTNPETERTLASCPAGFGKFLSNYSGEDCVLQLLNSVRTDPHSYGIRVNGNVLRDLSRLQNLANLFMLMDKAQSLGATIGNYRWRVMRSDSLMELEQNFKDFAKYCRENENPSICDFLCDGGYEYYCRRFNLDKYHLSDEAKHYLYQNRSNLDSSKVPYAAYYMARGLYEFCDRSTMSYLNNFFKVCDKLGVTPPKEDFYRAYINLHREYEMRRKEIDAAALRRVYNDKRNALTFEMGDYAVVIPQTTEDFQQEADSQHNCVYSMYLEKVLAGQTHVVFVRRKDALDKSVITCEVCNGRIIQFLKRYNNYPVEEDLLAFRTAYADYLCDHWHD